MAPLHPSWQVYASDGSRGIRIPYLEETILQLTPLIFSACQATCCYDLTSQVGFPSGERNHWLASRCEHSNVHRGYISHYTSVNGRSHSCIGHEYSFSCQQICKAINSSFAISMECLCLPMCTALLAGLFNYHLLPHGRMACFLDKPVLTQNKMKSHKVDFTSQFLCQEPSRFHNLFFYY